MSPILSSAESSIIESPIRRIAQLLEKAGADPDIISFGGGAPSLAPPKEVVNAMISSLKKDAFKAVSYTSTKGLPSLREKIAGDLTRSGDAVEPSQIALTTGATGGLFTALEDIINPGEEIVVSDPTYVGYEGPALIDRAKIRRVPVKKENDFQLTPDLVNEAITKKTKAIIILSPDNPTGRIQKKKNVKGIADIAKDNNLWIVSDDTYKDIIYEGSHTYVHKYAPENTITACTFSKSSSLPGLRLGYVYGPKEAINGITKLSQYIMLCPNKLSQTAAESFYSVKDSYLKESVIPVYKKKREVMGEMIKKHLPICNYVKPHGAFYYFIDLCDSKLDDEEFCNRLLEERKVVAIPGKYFGNEGKGHIRLTFVSESEKRIEEGVLKIKDFMEEL
ncbi:MAG: pyridoxal phosphate-dependent aminotransferase [archaeon]|nr:pyridoxal phosphate-dependent aminotransferase [archaeon]|tara:strand:+ start:38028 stop:39203 length:1176 start_codon:yes stop_codon:yes gene_type:complete